MLTITDAEELSRALAGPLPAHVRYVLNLRADLIDLATFVIAVEGDDVATIEAAVGIQIVPATDDESSTSGSGFTPLFEWVLDHGGVFEAPVITSDDGTGVILLVPDCEVLAPMLVATLRNFACPANPANLSHSQSV